MSELITRRSFAGALSPIVQLPIARAQQKRHPNVLLILADDLGYGDIGLHGAPDVRTPNMDALAALGVRFTNFYSNCPVCSPTRAALLTGCYPETVGVPGVIRRRPETSWGYLSPKARLLPEVLSKAGYQTALVGKWHLGEEPYNLPNARGFQEFRGMLGGMVMDYYNHQGHQDDQPDVWHNGTRLRQQGHATDLFTTWAQETIASWRKASKPAFLYLAYNAPHNPVQPPAEWLDRVRKREPSANEKRAKLIALIEHMDDGIGRVMKTLRDTGQLDNTLVIFTSDNGGDCPEEARNLPWRGCKGEMYEGGIRVPGIVSWPGQVKAGSQCDEVALSMDLAPTICEVAGLRMPSATHGLSLVETIKQGRALPARDLFWTRLEGVAFAGNPIHAVRRGDWKLVHNTPFTPLELYNLKNDPYERTDLAKANPKMRNDLAAALMKHVHRGGQVPWHPPDE
ncbi:MAG: sulfatase-like hydrolase/transferase [Bryobacterales bacterium]|nr:sulfatase-like hydrolase/transferase [Bryobacterales bacterium]